MPPLRVAVIGASGYSGEELVRLLARHPQLQLSLVTSRTFAGQKLRDHIYGLPSSLADLHFTSPTNAEELAPKADLFFLALPHGVAAEYVMAFRKNGKIVIDLSADFRVKDPAVYREFYEKDHPSPELLPEAVYGLPELHREKIAKANLIASPGCYPTTVLLALAPAIKNRLIDPATIVVNSLSGISGAGKKAEMHLLYVELNENMRAYGVPKHRHLSEMEQELALLAGVPVQMTFIPHLVPLSRGMFSSISVNLAQSSNQAAIQSLYESFYKSEPFVEVLRGDFLPEVKNVVRTNRIQIAVRIDSRTNRLLLFSAIDNLVKGAGGQAIQSMNIRCGFEETAGLVA